MIQLHDIRYVRVGTADMDHGVSFATRILGLELGDRDSAGAYLRSDDRDHTLVYIDAPAEDHTVGFELPDLEALDAAAAELDSAGIAVKAGTASECDQRRVSAFVSFREPSGTTVDLVAKQTTQCRTSSARRWRPDTPSTASGHRSWTGWQRFIRSVCWRLSARSITK